jgi:transposase
MATVQGSGWSGSWTMAMAFGTSRAVGPTSRRACSLRAAHPPVVVSPPSRSRAAAGNPPGHRRSRFGSGEPPDRVGDGFRSGRPSAPPGPGGRRPGRGLPPEGWRVRQGARAAQEGRTGERQKRRRFTTELEAGAAKRLLDGGEGLGEVATGPGLSPGQLSGWRNEHLAAGSAEALAARKAEQAELQRLKRENKRLEEEVEILRKAAAFFARGIA